MRKIHIKKIHNIKINKCNSQEVEDEHEFENKLFQEANIFQPPFILIPHRN